MEIATEKRFRCSTCQQSFTRNDHLKRHQLRHTGSKPYQCQFCQASFARSDSLRDHYTDCPARGERKIPATNLGGRRRHACSLCVSMKLRCDGNSPCNSCRRRKIDCSNVDDVVEKSSSSARSTSDATEQVFDRGSIRFLLNGGSEGWVSSFRFPPGHGDASSKARGTIVTSYNTPGYGVPYTSIPNLGLTDEPFTNLFSGPFGFLSATPPPAHTPILPFHSESMVVPLNEGPERPYITALVEAIMHHMPIDSSIRGAIFQNLQFLSTTSRISRFIQSHFTIWHPNARVIHRHSFEPEKVSKRLLAALVLMGALYTQDQLELYAAKALADYIEIFCFSSQAFTALNEINHVFSGVHDYCVLDPEEAFQDLQACLMVVIAQHWAGNKEARRRAMESRFGEIIGVARKLGLMRSRQLIEDRASEILWLKKESRIRTMAWIIAIDCAFTFFQNFPCRLALAELACDLPCEESIFESQHPFSEPNFLPSRQLTVNDAFEQLFVECPEAALPASERLLAAKLTVLDMFILVHVLYAYVNAQMTLLTPLLRVRKSREIDEDTSIKAIKGALNMWYTIWINLRSTITDQEYAAMGFWKNGYNYWLIAQLLMSKKDKVDSVMRMDFGEDKLKKLRLLLQDDHDSPGIST